MKKFILFLFFAMAAVVINTSASPTKVDIYKDVGIHATIDVQTSVQPNAEIYINKNFPGSLQVTYKPVLVELSTSVILPLSVLNANENSINYDVAQMCRTVSFRYFEINSNTSEIATLNYNEIALHGNKCHRNC